VQAVPRDLMAVDEAHRLRNGHEPSNVIAGAPRLALAGKHRLLLTATPLPNSLREFI
jgi:SNF2 family DNA or RNA helicase